MGTVGRYIWRICKWTVATLAGLTLLLIAGAALTIWWLIEPDTAKFGHVQDEALRANRLAESLRGADEPYFADMDKGLLKPVAVDGSYPKEILQVAALAKLPPEEVRQSAIRGQNAWLVWTGGNDRFWDFAARTTLGSFDLLKTLSSHPSQSYGRDNRFRYLGLVNEPCFTKATGPDDGHFGLWLDRRDPGCAPDPFGGNEAADQRYPGIKIGARGTSVPYKGKSVPLPVGSYYGEPTGILGLRLFPNPDFDAAAAAKWDPKRYYDDPDYYNDKDLVRPYRVGMSCAFCHVGPNPVKPPQRVDHPVFSEITSNPGAQYYWVDRIFFWNTKPRGADGKPVPNEGNFLFQLFHTNPPGSLDTSLVSTDYMNNPRTMNAVYEVIERLRNASKVAVETIKGDETDNKQFPDYPQTSALGGPYSKVTASLPSMRVLKDGADSVGTLGALNRVYLNIGLFSEEWLLHFRPFLGGQKISPIRIADAQKNSSYWNATEAMSPDLAVFFLVTARADHLADAPGGDKELDKTPADQIEHGKVVFAENCAACHSSKQPTPPVASGVDTGICAGGGNGPQYRQCWDRFWAWAQSDAFKQAMVALATDKIKIDGKSFLEGNYLSTERRVPIDVVGTNSCSAIATNGLSGDIWDNFTSSTYKSLPPPKEVTVYHPVSGAATPFQPMGNGRGYLRPPSLISLWSTAPYLLNNSVGHDDPYDRAGHAYGTSTDVYATATEATCPSADVNDPDLPCVANRLTMFDRSIRQMLSPETRRKDTMTEAAVPGYIYRTTAPTCLVVPKGFVPNGLRPLTGLLNKVASWAVKPDGSITLGPFPAGFPVNALANTQLLPDNDDPHPWKTMGRFVANGPGIVNALAQLGGQCTPAELADPAVRAHAEQVVRETGLIDKLVAVSKCPDYVVNAGHTFGSTLPQSDKDALIAFLKRF